MGPLSLARAVSQSPIENAAGGSPVLEVERAAPSVVIWGHTGKARG